MSHNLVPVENPASGANGVSMSPTDVQTQIGAMMGTGQVDQTTEQPAQGINIAQGGQTAVIETTPGITSTASSAGPLQAQTMGALAPLLMQPLLAQNLLQQQTQQAMIHNLLNPQSFPQPQTGNAQMNPGSQVHGNGSSTPTNLSLAAPMAQNPQVEAIQNLMKLTSQQPVQPHNPQLNVIQNLITLTGQHQHPNFAATGKEATNGTIQGGVNTEQTDPNASPAVEPVANLQTVPVITVAQPGMVAVPQVQTNMLQQLLTLNAQPAPTTNGALFMSPQNPQLFAINPAGMLPTTATATSQHQVMTNPNQLVMQNLLSQMAGANPGLNSAFLGTTPTQPPPQLQQQMPQLQQQMPTNGMAVPFAMQQQQQPRPANVNRTETEGTSNSTRKDHLPMPIFLDFDEQTLTEYQCLLRKQIEIFEAGPEDIKANAQGRNNPILLGQVGIRCRHCTQLPIKIRPRGSVYYSRTIVSERSNLEWPLS